MKKYKFYQYPRGTNRGGVLDVEICPTISCSSWENNCFLIEIIDMGTDKTICLNSKVDGKQPSVPDRIYSIEGCAVAITSGWLQNIAEPKIINPLKGQSDNGWHFEQQVYDAEGIARAVKAGEGSGNIPKVIEPISVAMRGRNPDNPSERGKSNGKYKQRLEMNESGVANTITSVQKDSMVAEPMCSVHPLRHKLEFDPNSSIKPIAPALRATDYKGPAVVYEPRVESRYRIRKLTPRECFRLMGVDDADIDKIQASGISNSQQYKLAGNSIVVDVLYHLFRKMFVETENENDQLCLF